MDSFDHLLLCLPVSEEIYCPIVIYPRQRGNITFETASLFGTGELRNLEIPRLASFRRNHVSWRLKPWGEGLCWGFGPKGGQERSWGTVFQNWAAQVSLRSEAATLKLIIKPSYVKWNSLEYYLLSPRSPFWFALFRIWIIKLSEADKFQFLIRRRPLWNCERSCTTCTTLLSLWKIFRAASWGNHCTVGRMIMKSTHWVRSHLLLPSLAPLTHSLAPNCSRAPLRSFTRSLTCSLRSSRDKGFYQCIESVDFISFQPTVHWLDE